MAVGGSGNIKGSLAALMLGVFDVAILSAAGEAFVIYAVMVVMLIVRQGFFGRALTDRKNHMNANRMLRHPGERRDPEMAPKTWIPAFARMTGMKLAH